jgi:hypothetical protein
MNNCYVCNKLVGENARTIRIAIGFGDFYEMDYIIVHEECYSEDVMKKFIADFDNPTI